MPSFFLRLSIHSHVFYKFSHAYFAQMSYSAVQCRFAAVAMKRDRRQYGHIGNDPTPLWGDVGPDGNPMWEMAWIVTFSAGPLPTSSPLYNSRNRVSPDGIPKMGQLSVKTSKAFVSDDGMYHIPVVSLHSRTMLWLWLKKHTWSILPLFSFHGCGNGT